MKRRTFITLLGGAAAWPLAAQAQQVHRVRRIGALLGLAEDDPRAKQQLAAFREGLEAVDWSEGRNVRIDYRFAAGGAGRERALANELVALHLDVILAHGTPITMAVQRESRAIPIVFVNVSDPIGAGFIASLARPGGNLTGLTLFEASVAGKWLAMLKEIAPHVSRAALIHNPKVITFYLHAAEALAPSLGI